MFFRYLLDRLKERSTWLGLVAGITGLGLHLSPDIGNSIISIGLSLGGLIGVVTKDKKVI